MTRKTLADDRRQRKLITALWALGVAAVVITLIYTERTAILYILCTLSIAALLVIVGYSDLAHEKESGLIQTADTRAPASREG